MNAAKAICRFIAGPYRIIEWKRSLYNNRSSPETGLVLRRLVSGQTGDFFLGGLLWRFRL